MLKTKTKITIGIASLISLVSAISSCLLMRGSSATECDSSPCSSDTTFQVDVKEVLSVTITSPTEYDSGNVGDLLTGQIDLTVTSNNANGFTTGIRAGNADATLTNNIDSSYKLENLSESKVVGSSFPSGKWGYSLDNAVAISKNYNPLPAHSGNPTKIDSISSTGATTASGSVYFAAKAGYNNPSGTYTGTVNISVVSGSSSPTPVDPDPVGPEPKPGQDPQGTNPYYYSTKGDSGNGITTYTTRSTGSGTQTVATEVSDGDNRSAYAAPHGETQKTDSNIKEDKSPLPIILATVSAVSAAAGLGFFIVAKRREEKDEEEEELN